ncbi:hypothetical protein BJF82_05365 [Kytococcus sp. CUA-901]|nr:hypothetical protein BJF82_05365 [Kytococcus sp. CUA-901]
MPSQVTSTCTRPNDVPFRMSCLPGPSVVGPASKGAPSAGPCGEGSAAPSDEVLGGLGLDSLDGLDSPDGLDSLGGLGLVDSDGLGLVSVVADSSPSAVQALRTRQRLTRSGTARRMKAPLVVVRVPPVGAVR